MSVTRKINHIAVIQSLQTGDQLTGQQLYDDIIKRHIDLIQSESIKMTHCFFDVKDKASFIDVLKYIHANSPYIPGGIIIHLETHGSEDCKGLVLSDKSFINWKEIVELLRPINVATCNNLFVTMATCFGRHLWEGINPNDKSPYQAYISASKEVLPKEVVDKFSMLFEELIKCGDLIHAYEEHEKTNTSFFYKDSETAFEDTIKAMYERIKTDATYRQMVMGDQINKMLESGEYPAAVHEYHIEKAFKEIYKKQKAAFDFSDCV